MTELTREALTMPCRNSRSPALGFVIRLELLQAKRQRLFMLVAAMLMLLGLCVCLSFGATAGLLAEPMAALRSLTALWSLALPLMALMAGFRGISGEHEGGTLGLLLTQPLSDRALLLGKWLGGSLPLLLALSVAAAMTLIIYFFFGEAVDNAFYVGLARLWVGGILLTLACHLSALGLSAWCSSSQAALFLGLGWLGGLLLVWDLLLFALVLLGILPQSLLEGLMNLNPISVLREFVNQGSVSPWASVQLVALFGLYGMGLKGLGRCRGGM